MDPLIDLSADKNPQSNLAALLFFRRSFPLGPDPDHPDADVLIDYHRGDYKGRWNKDSIKDHLRDCLECREQYRVIQDQEPRKTTF